MTRDESGAGIPASEQRVNRRNRPVQRPPAPPVDEWVRVDFHDVTSEGLLESFRMLEANLKSERNKLREIGEHQRSALDDQCDRFTALLTPRLVGAVSYETS